MTRIEQINADKIKMIKKENAFITDKILINHKNQRLLRSILNGQKDRTLMTLIRQINADKLKNCYGKL